MRTKSKNIANDRSFVVGKGAATRHLRWWRYDGGWDVNLSISRKSARPADVFVDFRDLDELHEFLHEGLKLYNLAKESRAASRGTNRIGDSLESSPSSVESGTGGKA